MAEIVADLEARRRAAEGVVQAVPEFLGYLDDGAVPGSWTYSTGLGDLRHAMLLCEVVTGAEGAEREAAGRQSGP